MNIAVRKSAARTASRLQQRREPGNTFVRQYAVSVETGSGLLKGPSMLETFPVLVEENHVIVDM